MTSRSSVTSKSPVAAAFSFAPTKVNRYVPFGKLITLEPGRALASMTAARREQFPEASAHTPSPGFTSGESAEEFTENCACVAKETTIARKMVREKRMAQSVDTERERSYVNVGEKFSKPKKLTTFVIDILSHVYFTQNISKRERPYLT
jgi:hypothetical protein